MAVKYSKLFAVTGAISRKPVTILVERVEAKGFRGIAVHSLEGEYRSREEFEKATKYPKYPDKIMNFLPLTLPGARRLADALNEALRKTRRG